MSTVQLHRRAENADYFANNGKGAASGAANPQTVTEPAAITVTARDILIVVSLNSSGSGITSPGAPWTADAMGLTSTRTYWRIATGTNTVFNWSRGSTLNTWCLSLIVVRDADLTNPIITQNGVATASTTTAVLPSISPAESCLLLQVCQANATARSWTGPGGGTQQRVNTTTAGTAYAHTVGTERWAGGATGTRTWTIVGGATNRGGVMIAIRDAPGAKAHVISTALVRASNW